MNAETGAFLYEKNADEPSFPASTTKIITALYALERKGHDVDVILTASQEAIGTVPASIRRNSGHPPYRLEIGGTHMSLHPGEKLPFLTLLYGLMLSSANDAANVIAEYVSGSCENFMKELNLYVRSQGWLDTTLYTPHGLSHPGHKTTARDLAKIMQAALRIPLFRTLIQTIHYPRPAYGKLSAGTMVQHNALIRPGKFFYPHAIGGKTGFTEWGGYTLVSAAEHQDRKLIVVLFGCEKLEDRYRDAISLFEAAFNEKKEMRILLSSDFETFRTTLSGGNRPLEAQLANDLKLTYYPSEEPQVSTKVLWKAPAFPIHKGDPVGTLSVLSPSGKVLSQETLLATQPVESTWKHQGYLFSQNLGRTVQKNLKLLLSLLGASILGMTFYLFHARRSCSH